MADEASFTGLVLHTTTNRTGLFKCSNTGELVKVSVSYYFTAKYNSGRTQCVPQLVLQVSFNYAGRPVHLSYSVIGNLAESKVSMFTELVVQSECPTLKRHCSCSDL